MQNQGLFDKDVSCMTREEKNNTVRAFRISMAVTVVAAAIYVSLFAVFAVRYSNAYDTWEQLYTLYESALAENAEAVLNEHPEIATATEQVNSASLALGLVLVLGVIFVIAAVSICNRGLKKKYPYYSEKKYRSIMKEKRGQN